MGSTQAHGYADAVNDGLVSLRHAIAANLTGNHYPPLPVAYVEPVLAAIDAVNDGAWQTQVVIPAGTNPLPRQGRTLADGSHTIAAGDLVEITHSWAFVNEEDYS